jgi:hypothetical protein
MAPRIPGLVMNRPIDVIVTGFTKNAVLCRNALAPLRALRQEGVIRAIHYVSWDSAAIDAFLAPLAAMEDVHLVRVGEPKVSGGVCEVSTLRQMASLEAALGLVAEPDALVVKTRPDFIFSPDFLRRKLADFETLCAPAPAPAFEVRLPPSPFARKIWLPWADANQPFFYADAAVIGLKRDLERLVIRDVAAHFARLSDADKCGTFAHAMHYAPIFLPRFPIFKRYLREYSAFVNDVDYRCALVPVLIEDAFFWHLLVAHAWILHTAFHIDCGTQGELSFYPNTSNAAADWSSLASLKLGNPYDRVTSWRQGTRGGADVLSAVNRPYGRLLDDAWPRALFTQAMPDFPASTLQQLAGNAARYETGMLREIEDAFYARLAAFHRDWHPLPRAANPAPPSAILANARAFQAVK